MDPELEADSSNFLVACRRDTLLISSLIFLLIPRAFNLAQRRYSSEHPSHSELLSGTLYAQR